MVVSGGKKYIKNEYLEEVSDDVFESAIPTATQSAGPALESGTVIVWEALRACHMHQVRILGRGDTWTSHDNVWRCKQEWEESKSSWGQVVIRAVEKLSSLTALLVSANRDTTHSSYNITFSSIEDVIQADPQLMLAGDDRIYSKDSCSNKGEEATHSSHKVTSSSSSILEDMQDSPRYD